MKNYLELEKIFSIHSVQLISAKKVQPNEMKLFFKNIWLFSKTNDANYFTKYYSGAAGKLFKVLMNAAENGKQLVNLTFILPIMKFTHLKIK